MTRRNNRRRREALGRAIRRARQQAGLTMTELGEEIGVTNSTVQGYEIGLYEPPGLRLLDLARVLGLNLHRLPATVRR